MTSQQVPVNLQHHSQTLAGFVLATRLGTTLPDNASIVDSPDMAQTDLNKRFQAAEEKLNKIGDKLNAIGERLAKMEGHIEAKKAPHPVLITLTGLAAVTLIGWWTWMTTQINANNMSIAQLSSLVVQSGLKKTAQDPQNPNNINEAEDLIAFANKKKLQISSAVLLDVGKRFISVSDINSSAWKVATNLLSYETLVRHVEESNSSSTITFNTTGACFPTEKNTFARFNIRGPCVQTLDGATWIDIVFVGVHIIYKGGPVVLHNVRFFNCTFEMPTADPGSKRLAETILATNTVDINIDQFKLTSQLDNVARKIRD